MSEKVAIVVAKRTAIGKFGGSLSQIAATQLGATVIKALLEETGLPPALMSEVIMGHVLTAGAGQNTARQAALAAGLPVEVSAFGVNLVCGSGLQAVNLAAQNILLGEEDIIIAGGQESMSGAPYLVEDLRRGKRMGDTKLVDSMLRDGLMDAYHHYPMGITAENIAEQFKISRQEQDQFSLASQYKAKIAQESGRFQGEIVPIEIKGVKDGFHVFDQDEFIKVNISLATLEKLKPVFKEGGTVSAGNSSGINDGAAAVMLMKKSRAKELGLKPIAYIESYATAGCDPSIMGMGPVYAIPKALKRAGWDLSEVDLIELNEAFASQSIAVVRELKLDLDKVNVNGGAIALGHPIGASGCRILVTLLYEMQRRKAQKGLASLCIGGGMGVATAVSLA